MLSYTVNNFEAFHDRSRSWVKGHMQGEGVLHYANGDHYEGHFENGMKSGRGEYKYASGDVYTGEYLKGDSEIHIMDIIIIKKIL